MNVKCSQCKREVLLNGNHATVIGAVMQCVCGKQVPFSHAASPTWEVA